MRIMIAAAFLFGAISANVQAQETPVPAPAPAAEEEEVMPAPVEVTVQTAELAAMLENAPFVHKGNGGTALYLVEFRSCPTCLELKADQYDTMNALGIDMRFVMYARADREGKPRSKPGERAMIAELWMNRDFAQWERWYAVDPDTFYETETLPPPADDDPARMALVEQSRQIVRDLAALLEANGVEMAIPALFWQHDGKWMTYIGYDKAVFENLILPQLAPATAH